MPAIGPYELLFLALLFGVATAGVWSRRSYPAWGGFLVGVLLGPIGLVASVFIPDRSRRLL